MQAFDRNESHFIRGVVNTKPPLKRFISAYKRNIGYRLLPFQVGALNVDSNGHVIGYMSKADSEFMVFRSQEYAKNGYWRGV